MADHDLTCPECEGYLEIPEENGDTACVECGARVNVHGYDTDAEDPEEKPEKVHRGPHVAERERTIARDLSARTQAVRLCDDGPGVW